MNEYDEEPVHGLPAALPEGERILWQGSPCPVHLAKTAFHVRGVACYFALLALVLGSSDLYSGAGVATALTSVLWTAVPAVLSIGLLLFLGWAYARGTVYTLTNHRLVIRSGLALTMAANIPFSIIEGAALKSYGNGTGDLVLQIRGEERASWLMLWPNVRPWHWRTPEPMLRVVPEAALLASLLTRELRREAQSGEAPAAATPSRSGVGPVPQLTPALS